MLLEGIRKRKNLILKKPPSGGFFIAILIFFFFELVSRQKEKIMERQIAQFIFGQRSREPWFIDHVGVPVAITVTPNSGDFLLHMAGMQSGASLSGSSIRSVELVENNKGFSVVVNYTRKKGLPNQYEEKLIVGQCYGRKMLGEAERFVRSLNESFYQK